MSSQKKRDWTESRRQRARISRRHAPREQTPDLADDQGKSPLLDDGQDDGRSDGAYPEAENIAKQRERVIRDEESLEVCQEDPSTADDRQNYSEDDQGSTPTPVVNTGEGQGETGDIPRKTASEIAGEWRADDEASGQTMVDTVEKDLAELGELLDAAQEANSEPEGQEDPPAPLSSLGALGDEVSPMGFAKGIGR